MKHDYRNRRESDAYARFSADPASFPYFSFLYDGARRDGFSGADFRLLSRRVTKGEGRETTTAVFAFADALEITLVLTHYFTHGVTEWTVWFENVGASDSGVLEAPEAHLTFDDGSAALCGILGDHVNQYRPYSVPLEGRTVEFSSDSGRATHVNFPYFLLRGAASSLLLAIGWAGTWRARFDGGADVGVTLGAVNGLRTRLKPHEKIRTALFVSAPCATGSEDKAMNLWRDWFVKYNLPRADAAGTPLSPFSTCCLASDTGLPNSDGSISERHTTWRPSMEKMLAEDAAVDFRWVDAGWYVRPDGGSEETDWWGTVGTWTLDPAKWPGRTFRDSTDFARAHGMKTLLWFEPERVTDPDNLAKNFGYDPRWAIRVEGERTISNNIGDPDCLAWTTRQICRTLREGGVEMYREDNNCNAAALWRHLDEAEGADRRGITECKFIAAHYQMWDDILRCTSEAGGCAFLDSCASGGGRNDLESMRRGIPLLRSDSDRTSTALRLSMTTAFNRWIPFCGANTKEKASQLAPTGGSDPYVWRASYLPALNVDSQFVQDPGQDFGMLRFGLREWRRVAPYLLGEMYVLTPWHSEADTTAFTAFCFWLPEEEAGVLLAFRQERCAADTLPLRLPPLVGPCRLTDEDSGEVIPADGPFTLSFPAPRTARLLWMKRA